MDQYVEDRPLFLETFNHLANVRSNLTTPLDEELLRRTSRNVDSHTPRETTWQLLADGEQTLQTLQQEPRPLTRLLEQVILVLPFSELKETITSEKLENGLTSPSVAIQLLILAYLRKAAESPSGTAFVASNSSLTKILMTTWLACESTEVADKALDTTVALLEVDSPSTTTFVVAPTGSGGARGQDLLWQRIFRDPDIYSLLMGWTSFTLPSHDVSTKKGKQQVTISQGRLFDFIARLAQIDWTYITTNALPDVERPFLKDSSIDGPYGGILGYAASHMIDQSDVLMEYLRQDFFVRLLDIVNENNNRGVTQNLRRAIEIGAGVPNDGSNGNGVYL